MAEKDLEQQLLEAGNALRESSSSADELLPQLDRVGKLLEKVDQSPSKSMLAALSPIIKAMVEDKLLQNQDEDVRVAVASCISEVTRITAPDAPYDDNRMKEVFQLIVSTFENLADKSSHSYSKRTAILETVAKVRSCVVMLDLECDDLIVEMFKHFLKVIRDHHPENVFSSMETIMTLVLEESEDIGLDMISPLLASLKKDNQEVQPIARKLAENVIGQSAAKVKPCLLEAKNSMNFSFDDYSTIVSTICTGMNNAGQDDHKSAGEPTEGMANGASSGVTTQGDENKIALPPSDEAPQDQLTNESKADTVDAPVKSVPSEDISIPIETGDGEDHPVPVVTGSEEDNPAPPETSPREEHPVPMESPVEDLSAPATPPKSASKTETDDITAGPCLEKHQHTDEEASVGGKAEPEVEPKSAQFSKKRSKRTKHSMKLAAPSESSHTDTDTDKETKLKAVKEAHTSPSRDPSTEVAVDEENQKDTEQLSPRKALESEPSNVLSPSTFSKKGGRSKKNRFSKKASPPEDVASKKETGDSEVKLLGRSGKKAPAKDSPVEKAPAKDSPVEKAHVPVKTSKVEVGSESDSDLKLVKTSTKKADTRDHTGDGSSSKKKVDSKKRVSVKTISEKESKSTSSKAVKDDVPLEETPKKETSKSKSSKAVKDDVQLEETSKKERTKSKPSKAVKDDVPLEETPKTSSKRKRTPSTGKATDAKNYGKELVGVKIKVWWPMDKMFYKGVVDSFDAKSKKHKVIYVDDEVEHLNLGAEKWERIEDGDSREDGEEETRAGSPDTNPELPKKKAKTGSEPSAKKGKTETSRDASASSSKSKGAAKKSSGKSADILRDDMKLADVTPKSSAKSEEAGGKSKSSSKKAAEGHEKAAAKDATKSGSRSKTPKTDSKSSTKAKSSPAKSKKVEEEEKEKSPEFAKASKSVKGKLSATPKSKEAGEKSGTPKGKETEAKSGKKRRRT